MALAACSQKEGSLIKKVAILVLKPALVVISCRIRTFSRYQVLRVCSSATIKILVALGTRERMAFLMRDSASASPCPQRLLKPAGKRLVSIAAILKPASRISTDV